MSFVIAFIVCLLLFLLFYLIGHLTMKGVKIEEENDLLLALTNIAIGASSFLIVVNLISSIIKDFNWGLALTFAAIVVLIVWQRNSFLLGCSDVINFFFKQDPINWIKQRTDKYFWILIGVINFIYGSIAFSTTKLDRFGLGNAHIFNINQLIAGNYPPKYSCLPNLPQKYHYGSDIFGALVSKFSFLHPEISLDVLTLIFLNLSLLVFYALTVKYLNNKPINKYLVPFAALLAWGPITNLFTKNPGEPVPQKLFEKINYLTQTRLIDSANWSGLVLNWFFAPPIGFSVFFFLIALYLLFRFFEGNQDIKFSILLGVFLSSFVIIDFSKLLILFGGLAIYLLFSAPLPFVDDINLERNPISPALLKNFGILILVTIILAFISGNWLIMNKEFIPLTTFYKLGTGNIDKNFGPLKSNIIMLLIYAFGFYQAYKLKQNWVTFLIPFFIVCFITPYFLTIPEAGVGKIIMSGNLLGSFALPLTLDFIEGRFSLFNKKLIVSYTLMFFLLSFSTLMFWAFGDKTKPMIKLEGNILKYTGLQTFPFSESKEKEKFVQYLKTKRGKNQTVLSDLIDAEFISVNTGLFSLLYAPELEVRNPIKAEVLDPYSLKLNSLFTLDSKIWNEQKVKWFYLTPRVFRYFLSPQGRMILLNFYLDKKIKLSLSNKSNDPSIISELFGVSPASNYKADSSLFMKEITFSPYLGIYNAKSNDFDGDKIPDFAFFDQVNKKLFIVYGRNRLEEEVDLIKNIFSTFKDGDIYVPIFSDYDGDGKTDIAFFSQRERFWYILNSSNSQMRSPIRWGWILGEVPVPADVDGDSKSDIAAFTPKNNPDDSSRWPTLLSSNNYGYRDSINLNSSIDDVPAYGDIDGDKKADQILYRPSQTTFYVKLSSRVNRPDQILQAIVGQASSRVVLGDYDGDGKVDLATWLPNNGEWEIVFAKDLLALNTINGPQRTFTLGSPTDIPMPADYNGDGKADIAVFHTNIGELEILLGNGIQKKMNLSKYKNLLPVNFIGV